MAKLSGEELSYYKSLYTLMSDKTINDVLTRYAKEEYNRAVTKLKQVTDLHSVGKYQGQIEAWEHLINIKAKLAEIMRTI